MAILSPSPKLQFFDANGNPLVGGKLYTYAAGTTTPLASYTDSSGGTANTNPIILDSRGEANVWLASGTAYKFVLQSAAGTTIWTVDNIDATLGTMASQNANNVAITGGTISVSSVTLPSGTANGVGYLNGSKVLTTGSALTFDGTTFKVNGSGQLMAVESTGDYSASGAGFIRFKDSTGNRGYIGFGGTSNLMTLSNTVASAALNFELAGSEIARLTSTGLGIGTSSPSGKLHIYAGAGATTNFTIQSDASNVGGIFFNNGTANQGAVAYDQASNYMYFRTNASEKMRLDSSGNLGLGVTPSAWGSSWGKAMQLGAGASIVGPTGSNDVHVSANAYYNGTAWTYINTGYASNYWQSSGQHIWRTAASSSGAISFTQAMTLDASGNLGIGTTSPGQKLEVAGTTSNTFAGVTTTTGASGLRASSTGGQFFVAIDDSTGAYLGTGTAYGRALYSTGAYPMVFFTNGTERARIDSSGNLLVGATGNAGRFTLNGATADSTANAVAIRDSASSTLFVVRNDGRIGTGGAAGPYNNTTASAANQYVDSSGVFYRSTSALKYKQDIRDVEDFDISTLRPVRYKSKCAGDDQTKDHLGLIADEAAAAGFEELVSRNEGGEIEGFQYERLTVVLLKKLQIQQAIIEQLTARLAAAGI